MWVETIFSREDLRQLLDELLPAKMRLGDPSDDAWLALYDLGEVVLVPETGLRVTCKAKLRWDVAGIAIPVTLQSLTVLLRPVIVKRETGDVLSFGLEIEHADLVNVPSFIDGALTDRVNRELAAKQDDMAWDFTTALSRLIPLPPRVDPIDAIDLKVAWGKLRIDADALVIAVSFQAHFLRDGAAIVAPIVRSVPPPVLARALRPGPGALLMASGVAFLSGAIVASMWTRARAPVW